MIGLALFFALLGQDSPQGPQPFLRPMDDIIRESIEQKLKEAEGELAKATKAKADVLYLFDQQMSKLEFDEKQFLENQSNYTSKAKEIQKDKFAKRRAKIEGDKEWGLKSLSMKITYYSETVVRLKKILYPNAISSVNSAGIDTNSPPVSHPPRTGIANPKVLLPVE